MLKQKLRQRQDVGRKLEITNLTNFKDIENPFADYSMNLQAIKKEKHAAWLVRKQVKADQIQVQIKEMEKKLDIYRHYKDQLGITLTKKERKKVLDKYNETGVEVLMGRKLFNQKQVTAAMRIQTWWRMHKLFSWFNLIRKIRAEAACKVQKAWKNFRLLRIVPKMMSNERQGAAVTIQKHLRGYLVLKEYSTQLSDIKMNSLVNYFDKMKIEMHTDMQIKIAYYVRKHLKKLAKEKKKTTKGKKKGKGKGKGSAVPSNNSSSRRPSQPARQNSTLKSQKSNLGSKPNSDISASESKSPNKTMESFNKQRPDALSNTMQSQQSGKDQNIPQSPSQTFITGGAGEELREDQSKEIDDKQIDVNNPGTNPSTVIKEADKEEGSDEEQHREKLKVGTNQE